MTSRGWWHNNKLPDIPGGPVSPSLPPQGRSGLQPTRFQGYLTMVKSTLEDAKGELPADQYENLLDIVRRQVMWELDRGAGA